MSDYMGDLSSFYGVKETSSTDAANSPTLSKKDRSTLDLNDYLKLMVAMFQNQSMDNTADIGDMMNNMVQMSVVQAISSISSLIEESTALNYAASLVGKEVTVGIVNNGQLVEIEGYVAATGTYNGQQVIFLKDKSGNPIEGYVPITSIMAIGWLSQTTSGGGTEGPEGPGDIEDPENPGGIGDPEDPGDIEDPENPGGIGDPEDPGGIEDPENPGDIGDPKAPEQSGEIENPDNSGGTGTPEVPEESGGTGMTGQTGQTEEPEIPDETERVEGAAAAEQT